MSNGSDGHSQLLWRISVGEDKDKDTLDRQLVVVEGRELQVGRACIVHILVVGLMGEEPRNMCE